MTAAIDRDAALSVVLVAGAGWAGMTRTLEHLCAQTARDRMEVLVVGLADMDTSVRAFAHPFHAFRLVVAPVIEERGEAAALGVNSATAPLVGLIEDHSFPAPEWAAGLIASHDAPWMGVGPCVGNANPESATSWVNFLLSYGPMNPAVSPGACSLIPWHNSAYKREVLEPRRARMGILLGYEGRLQAEIVASGGQLLLDTSIRTDHLNVSRISSSLRLNLNRGRIMCGLRAEGGSWSLMRRGAHAVCFPLFPFLLWRSLETQFRMLRIPDALLIRVSVALIANLVALALGEAAGAIFGVGNGVRYIEDIELRRARHMRPRERHIMTTHSAAYTRGATA